jgi:hypothetical protein
VFGFITRCIVPAYRPQKPPSRKVAIVVPLSDRLELTPEEEQSLRNLCCFLAPYDKFFVAPSEVKRDGFRTVTFPRKFFGSYGAHTRMVSWPGFYRRFADYEYILIHHLDSLVLSDQLLEWCDAGWDFIGAPWLPCSDTPWVKNAAVGNGGFALYNVANLLRVLHNRYRDDPKSYWSALMIRHGHLLGPLFRFLNFLGRYFKISRLNWPLEFWERSQDPDRHGLNNDYFWSSQAVKYLPSFRVAPVEDALKFAFEGAPRKCFEMNGRRLPFGCHAWARYDRAFWEPFVVGADEPAGSRQAAAAK